MITINRKAQIQYTHPHAHAGSSASADTHSDEDAWMKPQYHMRSKYIQKFHPTFQETEYFSKDLISTG